MRRGAHTPIFDPRIRKGQANPGRQVGAAPCLTLAGFLVDHTDLEFPRRLTVVDTDYLLVDCVGEAVALVDVFSDPVNPVVLDTHIFPGTNAAGMAYSSGLQLAAVCENLNDRVSFFDPDGFGDFGSVTDATNLNNAIACAFYGDYLIVCAADADRVTVVDPFSVPDPTVVGSVVDGTNLNFPDGIEIHGDYAVVVSNNSNSLAMVHVLTPTAPAVTGAVIDATALDDAEAVVVDHVNEIAYVYAYQRITSVDISTPASPTVISSLFRPDVFSLGFQIALSASGGVVVVPSIDTGHISVVDVSDPADMSVIASLAPGGQPAGVAIVNGYAFLSRPDDDRVDVYSGCGIS